MVNSVKGNYNVANMKDCLEDDLCSWELQFRTQAAPVMHENILVH